MTSPLTQYQKIIEAVNNFDDSRYAATRNFTDGNVSRLSPYISRGVITTKTVYAILVRKNPAAAKGKFVQELLWRDYFQRVLQAKPDLNNRLIRHESPTKTMNGLPIAVMNAATGINAIDLAVTELYQTGYMHNHFRMYVAALCCNMAKSNFQIPAKWMYYHLLDADIASNYASWQWVAGHITGKVYIANQENIDHYSKTTQSDTFLDRSYEDLSTLPVPDILSEYTVPILETLLPKSKLPQLTHQYTLLYTIYNLDPLWRTEGDYNRVLILEPSHFKEFPISEKVMQFVLDLTQNISGIQIFSGEFSELKMAFPPVQCIAKEHPILQFEGAEIDARDWIVPEVEGFFQSFSKYYSKCQKYLKHEK